MDEPRDPYGFHLLPRRRFLRLGLGGVGLAAAGIGGLYALRGSAPEVAGLRFLGSLDFRTLDALTDTVIPRGGAFPIGARDVELAREIDRFMADMPAEFQRDLSFALTYVEYGPLIHHARLETFSSLSETDRTDIWHAWEISGDPLRGRLTRAFTSLCQSKFYDHEDVWPHIGYPGPLFSEHI